MTALAGLMHEHDLAGHRQFRIAAPIPDGLRLINCGSDGEVHIEEPPGAGWDAPLIVVTSPEARRIYVAPGLTDDLEIQVSNPQQVVLLRAGQSFGVLKVRGGGVDVGGSTYAANSVSLINGALHAPDSGPVGQLKTAVLSLSGDCHVGGQLELSAISTVILSEATPPSLSADKEASVVLGTLQPDPDWTEGEWIRRLSFGPGAFRLSNVHSSVTMNLEGGKIEFHKPLKVGERFTIKGYGTVLFSESAFADDVSFEPLDGHKIDVSLEERARLSARGRLRLESAARASQLRSEFDDHLSIVGIGSLDRSDLGELDFSGIPLADLEELDAAERVEIWSYPRRSKARTVEAAEGAWRDEPKSLGFEAKSRIAHRWRRISDIVSSKKSTGSSQSRARYTALHWRRKALRWSWGNLREKLLLLGYWALGYGGRILRPLATFAVLTAIGAATQVDWSTQQPLIDQLPDFFEVWRDLALSPLSVLRVVPGPQNSEAFVFPLMRLAGIVCITLSVLATRRLARAD